MDVDLAESTVWVELEETPTGEPVPMASQEVSPEAARELILSLTLTKEYLAIQGGRFVS